MASNNRRWSFVLLVVVILESALLASGNRHSYPESRSDDSKGKVQVGMDTGLSVNPYFDLSQLLAGEKYAFLGRIVIISLPLKEKPNNCLGRKKLY